MMGGYLLLLLLAVVVAVAFNPITWIIVVAVVLLVKKTGGKNKTKATRVQSGTAKAERPTPAPKPPKPPNPMTKWNWLLYIGSFLIVMAMFYFINTINDSYVAPSTIIMTLVIYTTGIAIYKKVNYLRPVAKAFVYSALCMIPLWIIALTSIGLPNNVAPLISAIVFTIASFAGSYLVEDQIMAHFAFLSITTFIWSFCPLLDGEYDRTLIFYIMYLAPMVTGLTTMGLHLSKSSILPKTFKLAAKNLGIAVMPITYCYAMTLFFIPDMASMAPLLRTVCSLLFATYAFAFWSKTRKRGLFVLLRFAAQALLMAIVVDLLQYSIALYAPKQETGKALCCIIVWLITFMAQIIYSLYCKKTTEEDEGLERAVSIISIICILITPMFCSGFSAASYAAVLLTICLIVAVLGVIHAIHYKNVSWSIATAASVMILPLIFGNYIATPVWNGNAYFPCYIIISLLFLLGSYVLQKIQKKETQIIGAISIISSSTAILLAATDINLAYVGYFISAAMLAGYAFVVEMNVFYEAAVYTCAVGFISMTNEIMPIRDYDSFSDLSTLIAMRNIIQAHIVGLALISTQLLSKYLYEKNNKVRFIVGYSIFSVMATSACMSFTKTSDIGWALLFLIEQVVALLYSVAKKETWLIWFSSIEIFLITFRLTSGLYFLWLGIIGVGLIAFVIWQLSKANKNGQINPPKKS